MSTLLARPSFQSVRKKQSPPTANAGVTPRLAGWQKALAWLVALYVIEIMVAKSWVMELVAENVVLMGNYCPSALLVAVMLYQYSYRGLSTGNSMPMQFMRLSVGGVVAWLAVNLINRTEPEYEALALAAFALMGFFAIELLPALIRWTMLQKAGDLITSAFTVWLGLSLASLVWSPLDIYDKNDRFRGICGNVAVASGIYQTIAIWFLSRLVLGAANWRWWALSGGAVTCLLLTKTRGSLAVSVLAILFGFWLLRRKSYRSEVLVFILLFAAFSGAAYLLVDQTAFESVQAYFRFQGDTFDTRSMNWMFGLQRLEGNEWHGLGILARHTAEESFGNSFGGGRSGYNQLYDPHNAYIYAAIVGGYPLAFLIGLVPITAFPFLRRAWPKVRESRSHLLLFAFLNVIAYLMSTFGSPAYLTLGNFLDRMFWMSVGIMAFCLKAPMPVMLRPIVIHHTRQPQEQFVEPEANGNAEDSQEEVTA